MSKISYQASKKCTPALKHMPQRWGKKRKTENKGTLLLACLFLALVQDSLVRHQPDCVYLDEADGVLLVKAAVLVHGAEVLVVKRGRGFPCNREHVALVELDGHFPVNVLLAL